MFVSLQRTSQSTIIYERLVTGTGDSEFRSRVMNGLQRSV